MPTPDKKLLKKDPRTKQIGKIGKLKIYVVDGEWIRNNIDDDFMSGHHLVYDYIPEDEIWIDSMFHKKEKIFIIIHELFEHKIMGWGLDYDTAHDMANVVENAARKHKERIKELLALI